jgi:uncharacterized protein YydD (DUF2326 family)
MQISRVYSDKPVLFLPIDFNCEDKADRLNVIYGEVRHPKDRKRDSHNLGKSTLLHLLDFLLLKGTAPEHFLFRHRERFKNFTFFIEIALNSGDFATVRRAADDPNKIAMARHAEGGQDFNNEPEDSWDHVGLAREEAFRLLDGWLDLGILKPHDYRKAITYSSDLRATTQTNFNLPSFSLARIVNGSHLSLICLDLMRLPSSVSTNWMKRSLASKLGRQNSRL